MVRALVLDKARVEQRVDQTIEKRLSRPQTGLLVGQAGSDERDAVSLLIPTPLLVGNSDAAGGAGSHGLDPAWMLAHAGQVINILPGGVSILGFYMIGPASASTAFFSLLERGLATLTSAQPEVHSTRYLAHFYSDQRRSVVKAFDTADKSQMAGGSSVDLRIADTSDRYHALTCKLTVQLSAVQSDEKESEADFLRSAVAAYCDRIQQRCLVCFDGVAATPGAREAVGTPDRVSMYYTGQVSIDAPSGARHNQDLAVAGLLQGDGVIECRALVNPAASVADAASALLADVRRSMNARLVVFLDVAGEDDGGGDVRQGAWPRRVFFPIPGAPFPGCEYVMPGEPMDDVAQRCVELLGVTPPTQGAGVDNADWFAGSEAPADTSSLDAGDEASSPRQQHGSLSGEPGKAATKPGFDKVSTAPTGTVMKTHDTGAQTGFTDSKQYRWQRASFAAIGTLIVMSIAFSMVYRFIHGRLPF